MMVDCTKVPTLADVEASKEAMDDIQLFTYSAADSFVDSEGVTRDTVNGRLKKMGYTVPINYVGGITFTTLDSIKTIDESGSIYAPKPSALPFTTSGAFIGDDDDRFFVVQRSGQVLGDNGKTYQIVACVIRQDSMGSGWYVINDSGHEPIGLDGVTPLTEADGKLTLHYNFTSNKIGALLVTPDERYASVPLTFGCSVGSNSAVMTIYHPFEARISGTSVAVPAYFGPEGDDWSVVIDIANGTYVFTHDTQTHSDSSGSPVTVSMDYNGTMGGVGISLPSKSGFTLQAVNTIAGKVTAALAVISENAAVTSVVWDGISTMTISHPTTSQAYDAQVVSQNPLFPAVVSTSGVGFIDIKFLDAVGGTVFTGASAPAGVNYMRGEMTPSTIPGGLKAAIQRGPVKVNAANVAGGNSNLWVYGIFEVT